MLYLCSSLSSLVPFSSKPGWLVTVFILPVDEAPIPKSVNRCSHRFMYLQRGIPGCAWINLYLGNLLCIIWKFDLICCSLFPFLLLPKVYNSEENIMSVYQCNQTKRFCCELGEDRVPDGNSKFNYWQWNEYKMFLHAQFWTMHCFKLDFCGVMLGRVSGW